MDPLTILREYGWLAVVLLYFGPKLWGFLTDRLYPQKVKEREAVLVAEREAQEREQASRDNALQAERERQALYLKSQIDRDDREFEHRKEIDNRIAVSIENTQAVIQQMSLAITVNNERITQLISAHSRHDNFAIGAHVELKEKMEQLEEMIDSRNQIADLRKQLTETQEKIKFVGKETHAPARSAGEKGAQSE